jgi:hypothetical protein
MVRASSSVIEEGSPERSLRVRGTYPTIYWTETDKMVTAHSGEARERSTRSGSEKL